jgi:TolA-binding protein
MSEEMLASRTPFQAALLAAGRSDGLAPGRKEKLFRNLSIAVGVPHVFGEAPDFPGSHDLAGQSETASQVAKQAAFKATAKAVGVEGLAAKVVAAAAITGALVWGGWQGFVASSAPSGAQAAVAAAPAPAAPAPAIDTPATDALGAAEAQPLSPDTAVNPTVVEVEVATASAKGSRSRAKASDSLAKELSLVDSARAALLRGEPAVALRTLSTYRSQFPRGALQAEATVQRVEALIAIGDRSSASTIGGAFLKRYPESPYSRRIASLLGVGREPQLDGSRKSK